MSVFIGYAVLFIPTCLIGSLLLRFFALEFIYRTPELFWSGIPTTLATIGCLGGIILLIVFKVTRPFQKIIT